jgi:hypothetical protein
MTTTEASRRRPPPAWSRRPYVGTLAKTFHSTLSMAETRERLEALTDGPDTVGEADGDRAWLQPRSGLRPPATTLRIRIVEDGAGARIECRFDNSRLDQIDLWVYAAAAAIGLVVSGSWLSGHMPEAARHKISAVAPAFLAALAAVALVNYGFRRWRQAVRDRLFDRTIVALGVPIE